MTHRFFLAVGALAVCGLAGCGRTGDVAGSVTFNGKTVASGTVVFLASDSLPYSANIEETGDYAATRIPTGAAKVVVVSPSPAAKPFPRRIDPKHVRPTGDVPGADRWFPLPDRYKDFATSGLTFDVRPGQNRHDIVLVDKK